MLSLLDPGNIAFEKLRLARTTCIDFHRETLAIAIVSCTKDDLRSGSNESAHAAFADAMTASGDDDDFILVGHTQISLCQENLDKLDLNVIALHSHPVSTGWVNEADQTSQPFLT